MISPAEAAETATALAVEGQATPKASVAKGARNAAPKKAKSGKKAAPAKKAPKSPKGAKKAPGARDGSKTATLLDLLKRKDGATLKELMKVSGWQAHSVRGFLSGTIGKKLGLARRVYQGRGRRAQLLRQGLIHCSAPYAPPG